MEIRFRQSDRNLFSFSGARTVAPDVATQWHRLDDVATHALPGGRALLVNRHTGQRGELPQSFLPLLNELLVFRPLDEHARTLHARLNSSEVPLEQVASIIRELARAGMLVSAATWLDRIDPGTTPPAPWGFVLTTCDRPDWFARAAESAARHLATATPPVRVIVIDDSRSDDALRRNRAGAVEYLDPLGFPVDYWDRSRREALAQQLGDTFPAESESIRWLLAPSAFAGSEQTFGQVRNLMSLLTTGLRVLAMDDDCELSPRARSDTRDRIQFRRFPRSLDAYDSAAELLKASEPLNVNPLQQHLNVLGGHPFDALEQLGQAKDDLDWLREADAATLDHLSRTTRIAGTRNGLAGDPGTADELAFYARPGEPAVRNAAFFNRHAEQGGAQRIFWRTVQYPMVYFDPGLMSILLGLDNQTLVPCVPPVGRGSNDDVLGALLSGIHPDQARFEFPWALPHRLDAPAPWHDPHGGQGQELAPPVEQLGDLLQQFVADLRGASVESRLTDIVTYLLQLAETNDADLRQAVDNSRVSSAAFRLRLLGPNLEDDRIQGAMRHDIERYVQNLEHVLAVNCTPDPAWLRGMRSSCAAMGNGLRIWPRLREYMSSKQPS